MRCSAAMVPAVPNIRPKCLAKTGTSGVTGALSRIQRRTRPATQAANQLTSWQA